MSEILGAKAQPAPASSQRSVKRNPKDISPSKLIEGQNRKIEELSGLLESRRRKIEELSQLLGARDQRIIALCKNEAMLVAKLGALAAAEHDRVAAVAQLAQLRWDRFLNSPAGWMCRILFRIPLTGIRVTNFVFGPIWPRLRAACEHLEGMIVAREWGAFLRTVTEPTQNRAHALAGGLRAVVASMLQRRDSVLVSVLIVADGDDDAVHRTLASIRAQTLSQIEIIVLRREGDVKSAGLPSQDGPDHRELITGPISASETIARGIKIARGTYVCCLHSGDEIASTYLEKCIFMLEDDAGSGMAYARAARSGDENAIDPRDFDADEPLTPVWTVPHAVFRRRLGVALKVDFRRLQEIGDQAREYWIRLAQICGRGRMINEDLVTLGPSERPAVDVAWPSARRGTLDRTPHSSTVALSAPAQGRRFRTLEKPISNLTEDRRPHLLVAVPWLPYGGAEMLLFDVLQRLARDWRLSIVTTLRHAHDMAPQFATLTADIFHLADMIAPSSFLDFLVAFARSRRAAVLLSSNLNDYYEIANELKARLPSLVAVDILHNDAWHLGGAVKASAALDRHVAVSHRVAASLVERGVPKKRIVVIPNGVDVDGQFSPGQINRDALRQSFNLRPDAFVVTYVGRLAEEKRPDAFLEIVELLRHTTPVEALMVGEGPLSEEIALTIRQQQLPVRAIDQVERQRVHEIYAVSDLLIVPSKIEGMPLVVLEALAMGCPVAATAAGDLKRVVVDGYNGYLVPVGDFRALVPIIRELAGDPRQQAALRSAARASVRAAGATLETMVTQYVRLLSDLTTRGR